MTVFVVSLFLPNTISFSIPTLTAVRRDQPPVKRSSTKAGALEKPSLFTQHDLTPPRTRTTDNDHVEFFAQRGTQASNGHFPKQEGPRSIIAPSDPHSPAWGSGRHFTQPPSRASTPPPADILKHNKTPEKAAAISRAGIRQPQLDGRSESHDRVFAHANWTVVPADQGNGGLRNAVQAAVRNGKLNDKIWVGTLGMPTDALEETQQKQDIEDRLATEYDSLTVFCKDSDFDGHYSHYCKQILWPVFHYQIPDNPKSKAYEDHSWIYYVTVNLAFADKIVKNWKRGDIIWIHDYHLLLVPAIIRKKLPDAKIGFFLHVAFPSSEVFRCLAVRQELLEGMLGANLIGFQIHEYARHFLQTCSRLLCVEATNDGVQLEERFVDAINIAIGIDPVALDMNRADPEIEEWLTAMQERYRGKKLIVARDKLDYVRGVRQKLLSYELFLNKYPEWRDRVVMIQVATSTTEQAELDATVSDIVTRVNSSWANLAYQPLVYLKQDISYPQYLALLAVADALMVASQREGMNLTCHEYLVCQDGKFKGHNKFGSLILSEFTGSSSIFGGQELSVNPWDFRQCAEAIKHALEMGDEEKETRWGKLYKSVMHHTADHWFTAFLGRLDKVYDEQNSQDTTSVPRLSINSLAQSYQRSQKRLFMLDYEGTLASWGSPHGIILTSPQHTLDALNDILSDERNVVYVMSGRQPEDLDRLFKRVPNLGLIAENGCFLKEFGSTKWIEMADPEKMHAWQESVEGIMQYYYERTPGSWIERRHCSLIFHYKSCDDPESASRQAGDCASHINDACEQQKVKAIPIDDAVIVAPIDWSKGTAATQIFEDLEKKTDSPPVDFLTVIGDGRDDEVVFRWANDLEKQKQIKHVTTVSLGNHNTEAGYTLTQGVTGKGPSLSSSRLEMLTQSKGVLTVLQKLGQLS
ncbi:glycosyltransferase family 20-domain-containing protein [Amylocarpus encephaloides]|uniref:Glycosyltransferase family 20-domain-containing protein n=1 Tax=Amylocarpus encephaloides TaxID=45428 RepID=A0A9P8C972_9HELO|nr:glycosyltransferase family 20-domain-containing protein [Amylocarpus encephaloides]